MSHLRSVLVSHYSFHSSTYSISVSWYSYISSTVSFKHWNAVISCFVLFFLSFQSHRLNRIPPFFVYLPTSFSSPRVHNSHHLFCYHSSRPFTVFLLVIFYLYLIKTSVYFPNMEYSIHFDGCTKFLFIIVLFYFIHQTFTWQLCEAFCNEVVLSPV